MKTNVNVSQRSLAKRLLIFLVIPVVLFILVAATIAIVVAQNSITTLYDKQLQNNAETLLALLHYEYAEEADEEEDDDDGDIENPTEELEEIVAEIESRQGLSVTYRVSINGSTLFTSSRVVGFPTCSAGFSNFTTQLSTGENVEWRCYQKTQSILLRDVPITVEFFDPIAQRRDAIFSLIFQTFSPVLLLPFVVMLAAWWGVQRGLKSLTLVSNEVRKRSVNNLAKIPRENQPKELVPIVDSVNGLLSGVELGVIREKQFTDDAAHELRTPITSIKMIEQLIRRDTNDSAITPHLDNLKLSAEHSSTLIDQLLNLARLQSTQSFELQSVDLNSLMVSQLGLLSPQLTEKNLSIELDGSLEGCLVEAHEPSLSLLINNLLTNAIKFSYSDGVIYIFKLDNFIYIEDDGPGIKPSDKNRVFDRFFRAAENRNVDGNGLGLALAKWAADAHNFTLSTSHPEKGSGASFKLCIEAAP